MSEEGLYESILEALRQRNQLVDRLSKLLDLRDAHANDLSQRLQQSNEELSQHVKERWETGNRRVSDAVALIRNGTNYLAEHLKRTERQELQLKSLAETQQELHAQHSTMLGINRKQHTMLCDNGEIEDSNFSQKLSAILETNRVTLDGPSSPSTPLRT